MLGGGLLLLVMKKSDLFGMVKWPFQGVVGDLQLGDEKGTLNHLVFFFQFFFGSWRAGKKTEWGDSNLVDFGKMYLAKTRFFSGKLTWLWKNLHLQYENTSYQKVHFSIAMFVY